MSIHFFGKPEPGRRTQALGLMWGLIPGWHSAYIDNGKWYHHSTCRVTCVICWRYAK